MKNKFFYTGIFFWTLFELARVYFVMPMPGSQELNQLDLAYFLHQWRWIFRSVAITMIVLGRAKGEWQRPWVPYVWIALMLILYYVINDRMAADGMFRQPRTLIMATPIANQVELDRLVIGVEKDGEARAYPIRFLGYHHQVQDSFGGKPILVTYCTVCRTGRVFEPMVAGRHETFRLVGMDHYNAMIEDLSTGSWWRQATGEAVAGPRKGEQLPELFSRQTSLRTWLELFPQTRIMQADPASIARYDTTLDYERGRSRKKLTGTDTLSWKRKSWVIGLKQQGQYRAYDWNALLAKRMIADTLGGLPVLVVLSQDSTSFFAFSINAAGGRMSLKGDTLLVEGNQYRLNGTGIDTMHQLTQVPAYQEFWHSWQQFQPATGRY
jgi:hypothetical protein